jgi:hypothetical protein
MNMEDKLKKQYQWLEGSFLGFGNRLNWLAANGSSSSQRTS